MSSSKGEEPVNEQAVANKFASMRSELNQIYSKITELEMDVSEHSLVINAIQPLDPSRRCFRMIGGVLVERTIKEVLPAVQRNKEGIEEVITRLNEALERKKRKLLNLRPSTGFGTVMRRMMVLAKKELLKVSWSALPVEANEL